jgi:hypothetical protein
VAPHLASGFFLRATEYRWLVLQERLDFYTEIFFPIPEINRSPIFRGRKFLKFLCVAAREKLQNYKIIEKGPKLFGTNVTPR